MPDVNVEPTNLPKRGRCETPYSACLSGRNVSSVSVLYRRQQHFDMDDIHRVTRHVNDHMTRRNQMFPVPDYAQNLVSER